MLAYVTTITKGIHKIVNNVITKYLKYNINNSEKTGVACVLSYP